GRHDQALHLPHAAARANHGRPDALPRPVVPRLDNARRLRAVRGPGDDRAAAGLHGPARTAAIARRAIAFPGLCPGRAHGRAGVADAPGGRVSAGSRFAGGLAGTASAAAAMAAWRAGGSRAVWPCPAALGAP